MGCLPPAHVQPAVHPDVDRARRHTRQPVRRRERRHLATRARGRYAQTFIEPKGQICTPKWPKFVYTSTLPQYILCTLDLAPKTHFPPLELQ